MTKREQARFIRELTGNVTRDLLATVPKLPDTWDGHELRQLIADRFALSSFTLKEDRRRWRAYQNTIITENLI